MQNILNNFNNSVTAYFPASLAPWYFWLSLGSLRALLALW